MPVALEITTAPTFEPMTLDEVKEGLRIEIAEDDAVLTRRLQAAREHVQDFTGRTLMETVYDLHLNDWPYPADAAILIPRPPLLTVDSISYIDPDGDSQTLGTSIYTVDTSTEPARVYLAPDQSWPSIRTQRKAITVTFTAGYSSSSTEATAQAAVPAVFKDGILLAMEQVHDLDVAPDRLESVLKALLWPRRVEWVS